MKLHIGCSNIYLENYINIDATPDYIVPDVPKKILEQNTTTIENYYKYDFCKGSTFCVVDIKSTIDKLPFENGSVEEIVLYQVLEHIPLYDLEKVMKEINRILKIDGIFKISVPDIKKTAELLMNSKTFEEEKWAIRLIYGTQKNKWSHHFCGYTKKILSDLLNKYDFDKITELESLNFYPAIHIKAIKVK